MAERFAALGGGVHRNMQSLVDIALADHLLHRLRTQVTIFVVWHLTGDNLLARHAGDYSIGSIGE